jgi:hypothetical protein
MNDNKLIRCIKKLPNWEDLTNNDGTAKKETQLMCFLMNTTGVYALNSRKDIWLLCYRLYIIYGARLSFDELLLNELVFATYYGDYDPEDDFNQFQMSTFENGLTTSIYTNELNSYLGLAIKHKVNTSNEKFEEKSILKAKRFWIIRNEGTILFPITLRDPDLRVKLLKGKKIGKRVKTQAAEWADLVTKYL